MMVIKGLIFDMDNTLLQSHINFKEMKTDVYDFLATHGLLRHDVNKDANTTATLIEQAKTTSLFTEQLSQAVWQIVKEHEVKGMIDARLEPHVEDLLARLSGKCYLTVLTNNAILAAISALETNHIKHYFDLVVGREQVSALKPSSAGICHILRQFPGTIPENWLCTGDSWIDGKASQDAGVGFISYQGDRIKMEAYGVVPLLTVQTMLELTDYLHQEFMIF